ncbi:MAG TPA: LPXTG cell wall anchor domain-containing protein [Candidatus Scubalenecus merdavium]|uniref:LPXTG cell wall anchor domain-containing protein n=1 Tax=Candidatus Scybalenecus merdavium TaxID=2840939 RepID=A0A9D1MTN4_9FIRM|nr:LPXTG cell wall anchor domain-containing protein [Candidatus Scubalenecus merdavium]
MDNSTKSPDTGSASDAAIMVSAMIAFICASGAAVVFVKGKKQKDF